MAITVHTQPNTLCLADGRLYYELSSNNQFSTAGVKHVFVINFAALPDDDDGFDLEFADGAIALEFVFKTTPDSSGLQLPIGDTGASVQTFVDVEFIPSILKNSTIAQHFDVASSTNAAIFTAKETGIYYNTTASNVDVPIGYINSTTGVDEVERENFEIRALLEVANGHSPTSYIQHELVAYTYANNVFLHLNKLLRGYYNTSARPTNKMTGVSDKSAAIIKFRLSVGEHFGNPASTQQLTIGSFKYALPGGAGKYQQSLGDVNAHIGDNLFLTHKNGKRCLPDVPELLNYWHTNSTTTFNAVATATLADGSTSAANIASKTSVAQYSLWAIDCSPANIATLLGEDVADIVSFTVHVYDPTGAANLTEHFTFSLVHSTPKDVTTLLFQNSFGVYEYYTFAGATAKKVNTSAKHVRLLKDEPVANQPVNFSLEHFAEKYIEVSSGFLNRSEMDHLLEIMRSPDVYRVADYLVPVLVERSTAEMYDTDSGTINGMNFTIKDEQPEEYA